MQEEEVLDFICPDDQEKIISVQQSETGENKMYCLKCFTQKQVSIEEFTKQLKELRIKQTKNLNQQQIQNEKGLERFKKVLMIIKDQFNQQIDDFIKTIQVKINNIKQDIQQEIELLNKPIQQLTLSQVDQNIKDLKNIKDNNKYQQQIKQIKIKVIEEYYNLLKQLSTQIEQELIEKKNEVEINVQSNEDDKKNEIIEQQQGQEQYQLKQYKLIREEKRIIDGGWAMTMNQDETIFVNSSSDDIQIWHFSCDGQLNLKQTLKGHTSSVHSLYFSKKGNMFISGSRDKTIKIWQTNDQDQWYCTQTLEGHEYQIRDILLDNDDNQLISDSIDKTIKIWMKLEDNNQWKCVQTLIGARYVFFISLNPDCNQLASTGFDGLRIWSKGSDKVWKKYQFIFHFDDDNYFYRIQYINNNELIVSTKKQGRIIRFIQNNSGLYEIISQLQLNLLKEVLVFLFRIIYNQQLGLVVLRHSNKHTYILKKQNNGEFIIHQVLNGNYTSGYMTKDGRICILHESDKQQHEIWKNE